MTARSGAPVHLLMIRFSRLLTANNPESGTITYSYDADGNLLQKTSPAPNQTGTATQTVSYCYDELHRVIGKGYGAQSCPLATPVVSLCCMTPAQTPKAISLHSRTRPEPPTTRMTFWEG